MLSHKSQLVFRVALGLANVDGITKWGIEYIKRQVFPKDGVSLEGVKVCRNEIEDSDLAFSYKVDGEKYAVIFDFLREDVGNYIDSPEYPHPNWKNDKYKDAIFRRDNYICHYCGRLCIARSYYEAFSSGPSIDHIIPRSLGGNNLPNNLVTACCSCNKGKRDRAHSVYLLKVAFK